MTATLKYNLKQMNDISNTGFYFEIPEDTYQIINYLCTQVGSSTLDSAIFNKKDLSVTSNDNNNNDYTTISSNKTKKRRGNKGMEISPDEWESIRTFQTTKIEQKTGIDAEIDIIRLYLNKLTDKTFLDMREKLIDKINNIISSTSSEEDIIKVGNVLYDLSSTNKFYSKIFADLFAELATMFKWLNNIFKEKYKNIMEQYDNIQYIDSEKDYDGFCEMNKINDRRRAITTFYLNLGLNGFISKSGIVKILRDVLLSVVNMINVADKKNEVDELTEIIAILFNKDMIDEVSYESDDIYEFYVKDEKIIDTINNLAQKKAKDYPSLSNKAIFKFMDLIEM